MGHLFNADISAIGVSCNSTICKFGASNSSILRIRVPDTLRVVKLRDQVPDGNRTIHELSISSIFSLGLLLTPDISILRAPTVRNILRFGKQNAISRMGIYSIIRYLIHTHGFKSDKRASGDMADIFNKDKFLQAASPCKSVIMGPDTTQVINCDMCLNILNDTVARVHLIDNFIRLTSLPISAQSSIAGTITKSMSDTGNLGSVTAAPARLPLIFNVYKYNKSLMADNVSTHVAGNVSFLMICKHERRKYLLLMCPLNIIPLDWRKAGYYKYPR